MKATRLIGILVAFACGLEAVRICHFGFDFGLVGQALGYYTLPPAAIGMDIVAGLAFGLAAGLTWWKRAHPGL